jgi:thiol-disulfide isomerase/thioredoxin
MLKNLIRFSTLILLMVACNAAPSPTALPTAQPNQVGQQSPGGSAGMQVVMVQSVITIGPNRFAIGLLDGDRFVKNAKVTLTFYDLNGGQQKQVGTVPATYREAPDGFAAMYTAEMTFPEAGAWGVSVSGMTSDGQPIDQKVGFDVVSGSPELAVGKKAPSARTPTVDSVGGDLKKLSSAPKPNPAFYRLSLDQALTSGKPTLVQFSTPAFCTSRLCGPVYDVIDKVYPSYAEKVNFVHVEVYKDLPNPNLSKPQIADAMTAWGLKTEPWTYLLDKNGVVVWRVEGLVTTDELQAALDVLLKAP